MRPFLFFVFSLVFRAQREDGPDWATAYYCSYNVKTKKKSKFDPFGKRFQVIYSIYNIKPDQVSYGLTLLKLDVKLYIEFSR